MNNNVKITFVDKSKNFKHHGIKGQKWDNRRFQNPDGSLTEEGRKRYGVGKKDSVTVNNKKNNFSIISKDKENTNGSDVKEKKQAPPKESLTDKISKMSDAELQQARKRLENEKAYRELYNELNPKKKSLLEKSLSTTASVLKNTVGPVAASAAKTYFKAWADAQLKNVLEAKGYSEKKYTLGEYMNKDINSLNYKQAKEASEFAEYADKINKYKRSMEKNNNQNNSNSNKKPEKKLYEYTENDIRNMSSKELNSYKNYANANKEAIELYNYINGKGPEPVATNQANKKKKKKGNS